MSFDITSPASHPSPQPDDEFDPLYEELPEADLYDAGEWVGDDDRLLIPTVDHGPVQVWFRNANEYLPVIEESPLSHFQFSHRDVRNKGFDPYQMLSERLPPSLDFQWLVSGRQTVMHQSRFAHEAGREPVRIPVWSHGQDPVVLKRFIDNYVDHGYSMIVVGFLPQRNRAETNRTLEWLWRLAAKHPHVKFHLAFGMSFRQMFGLNFASADCNPSYPARFDRVVLPNGNAASKMRYRENLKWIHVLGFSMRDLHSFYGRVRFNIASALWASENYRHAQPLTTKQVRTDLDPLSILNAKTLSSKQVTAAKNRKVTNSTKMRKPHLEPDDYPQSSPEPSEPYAMVTPITNAPPTPVRPKDRDNGDKIVCNSCSLARTCHVYREGAICAVTTSPASRLATIYGTRDVESIKGALAEVLGKQVERYERSAQKFRDDDESDVMDLRRSEHLMKMENSLVRSTETFMKILDPQFRESNIPAIQNNTMHVYNPRVLVADVVRQLEASGVTREQLTPQMIQAAISQQQGDDSRVIEG